VQYYALFVCLGAFFVAMLAAYLDSTLLYAIAIGSMLGGAARAFWHGRNLSTEPVDDPAKPVGPARPSFDVAKRLILERFAQHGLRLVHQDPVSWRSFGNTFADFEGPAFRLRLVLDRSHASVSVARFRRNAGIQSAMYWSSWPGRRTTHPTGSPIPGPRSTA
jgi:hypothetical protein